MDIISYYSNLTKVIPIAFVLFAIISIFLVKRYSIGYFFIFFLGVSLTATIRLDVLILIPLLVGLYGLGYYVNNLLGSENLYSLTNFCTGLVFLFFPVFAFSVISHYSFFQTINHLTSNTLYLTLFSVSVLFLIACVFVKQNFASIRSCVNGLINSDESYGIRYVLMLFLLLIVSLYAMVPQVNYDDLAIHYHIQSQFSLGHYPEFDPVNNIWAFSQWVFDVYYGLFEYAFNTSGRSILNFILFIGICVNSYSVLRTKYSTHYALLVTLLACSSPLLVLSLTTSQTELVSLFLISSVVYQVSRYNKHSLALLLPIFAFAVCIKISNAVLFIFPLIGLICYEFRKYKLENILSKFMVRSLTFSIAIAFGPYLWSYLITGNPVFPLYNEIFRSEFYPFVNFYNNLYTGKFSINAFYSLVFETSKYLESKDGVLGYQFIFLPFMILASLLLMVKNINRYIILFISLLTSVVVLFYFQQYARYLGPALFFLAIVFLLSLPENLINSRPYKLVLSTASVIIIFFNLAKIPDAIWYMGVWKNNNLFSSTERSKPIDPVFYVNDFINAQAGEVKVLYHATPYAANLEGKYLYDNWYNPKALRLLNAEFNEYVSYLREEKVTHLVVKNTQLNSNKNIKSIIAKFGDIEFQNLDYTLYRLELYPLNLEKSSAIPFGKPKEVDGTYQVTPGDFYVIKHDGIINHDAVRISLDLACPKGGVWKDYIEYNRDTFFTAYFNAIECSSEKGSLNHSFDLKLPNGTDDIRLFLQPIQGNFTVNSITIEAI